MGGEDDDRTSATGEPVTAPAPAEGAEASIFSVLLLNDDRTPAEFVVSVLEAVFAKTREDASAVMLETHRAGRGVCGVYAREEAAAKVERVAELARRNGHPLSCAMEAGPPARSLRPDDPADREVGLFDPARHVPLPRPEEGWNPDEAHAAVREIAEDALARFDPERFWPAHPLDDGLRDGATSLYFGATGVVWALDHLRRSGAARIGADFAPVLGRLLAANRAEFARGPYPGHASWLMGDVAALALALRLAPDGATADALHARCAANMDLPVLELMWGTPGSMLACLFAHRMAGGADGRWQELYLCQAARLLAGLEETADGPLWKQDLYGQRARYLGPVHGFAGNMLPLLRGWDWLGPAQRARVAEAVSRTLAATARRSPDGAANWPAVVARASPPRLVQHCHGAPGMVTAFADGPVRTPELDILLAEAGELTWRAGPVAKGPGLCHGTAGNGYAFLKLWRHTGDGLWLGRARAFASAAISQHRATRARYGRGRYSLWTGDLGVAAYLWDCLEGEARFPTADFF